MDLQDTAIAALKEQFADDFVDAGEHAGQKWASVKRDRIVAILTMLRDELGFNMMTDLTCVDYLNRGKPERFAIVYILYNLDKKAYFRVNAWVPEDDPEIDTAAPVWKAAPWAEREVWDLFGIQFCGHPDLKRILLPDGYEGHPLRKDYPVTGHGERHQFPRYQG